MYTSHHQGGHPSPHRIPIGGIIGLWIMQRWVGGGVVLPAMRLVELGGKTQVIGSMYIYI